MRGLVGSSRLLPSPPLYFFFFFGKTPPFLPESERHFFFLLCTNKKQKGGKQEQQRLPKQRPPTMRHNNCPPTSPKKKYLKKKRVRTVTHFSQPWFGGTAPLYGPVLAWHILSFFSFFFFSRATHRPAGRVRKRSKNGPSRGSFRF